MPNDNSSLRLRSQAQMSRDRRKQHTRRSRVFARLADLFPFERKGFKQPLGHGGKIRGKSLRERLRRSFTVRLTILSRSSGIPSTKRMAEAARARGHQVRVLNPTKVELHL